MSGPNSLQNLWHDLGEQLQLLAVSGGAGAAFRTLISPEKRWKRRVVQGVAGSFSALFLGGVLASIIDSLTHAGAYAYLAAGFIMGSGGELAVQAIQERFLEDRQRARNALPRGRALGRGRGRRGAKDDDQS